MLWATACPDLQAATGLPANLVARLQAFAPLAHTVGTTMGVDPELVAAVAWVESKWSPTAVSSANAKGIMQLIPVTGKAMAAALGVPWEPFNPVTNTRAGTLYLSRLFKRWSAPQQNWWRSDAGLRAVASYLAGAGNVSKYGPSKYDHYTRAVSRAQWALRDSRLRCQGEDVPAPEWPKLGSSKGASSKPRPRPPGPRPASSKGGLVALLLVVALGLVGLRG